MMKPVLALLPLLLLAVPATRAEAQLVYVSGQQTLAFGGVMPGIPRHISPSDPIRSGRFEFQAAIGNRVRIRFTLPNRLNGPAGATMPISFGNADAIIQGQASGSIATTFNPRSRHTTTLTGGSTFNVWIGGTVTPSAGQALGAYSNTITMTITVL
jgi:hypothetical protein